MGGVQQSLGKSPPIRHLWGMEIQPIESVFRFCPRCGVERGEHPDIPAGENPFRCHHCDYSHFFAPATAVGGLLINEANELLLVRRARDPGKGMFGLPGGFVDSGETVEQALAREVMEETKLTLSSFDYLASFPNLYVYRGIQAHVIDMFYVVTAVSPEKIELAPEELDSYLWCRPNQDQLDQMAFPSNRRAIQLWLSGS